MHTFISRAGHYFNISVETMKVTNKYSRIGKLWIYKDDEHCNRKLMISDIILRKNRVMTGV